MTGEQERGKEENIGPQELGKGRQDEKREDEKPLCS